MTWPHITTLHKNKENEQFRALFGKYADLSLSTFKKREKMVIKKYNKKKIRYWQKKEKISNNFGMKKKVNTKNKYMTYIIYYIFYYMFFKIRSHII